MSRVTNCRKTEVAYLLGKGQVRTERNVERQGPTCYYFVPVRLRKGWSNQHKNHFIGYVAL